MANDLAYLAGIIDGEGSILITKWKGNRLNPTYRTRVAIQMTDREPVKLAHVVLGGFFFDNYKTKSGKRLFMWCVEGTNAVRALKKVHKYLRVKKNQAALIYKIQNTFKNTGLPLTRKVINKREVIRKELNKLHG